MNKFVKILKDNVAFAIIYVIGLVFFLIALLGGDYQTVTRFFEVDHYTFLNGLQTGVPITLLYIIGTIVILVGAVILKFFVPEDRMKKRATVVAGLYLAIALLAAVMMLLIVVVLTDQCEPSFTSLGDPRQNAMIDVVYRQTYNFPLISMAVAQGVFILLGAYGAATCSE